MRRTASVSSEGGATARVIPISAAAEPAPGPLAAVPVEAEAASQAATSTLLERRPLEQAPHQDRAPTPQLDEGRRLTVRIERATEEALETECYKRRLAGQKTNVSEIVREILSGWAAK